MSQILKMLSRSIKDVEAALGRNRASAADGAEADDNVPEDVAMDVTVDPNQPPGDALREGMTGKSSGLASQVPSLQKMAQDVGPIIDSFNSVLVRAVFTLMPESPIR